MPNIAIAMLTFVTIMSVEAPKVIYASELIPDEYSNALKYPVCIDVALSQLLQSISGSEDAVSVYAGAGAYYGLLNLAADVCREAGINYHPNHPASVAFMERVAEVGERIDEFYDDGNPFLVHHSFDLELVDDNFILIIESMIDASR